MRLRAATADDSQAILGLWSANDSGIPEGGIDTLSPYLGHLMATGRVEVVEEGEVVLGFGAVVARGGVVHLADLFVLPDWFGRGIGRRLLASLYGEAPTRTTFASSDPRALPLYVRSGMSPLWPNLYLEGTLDRLPETTPGYRCEPAEPDRLAELEQAWNGSSFPADHRFWASLPESRPFVVLRDGAPVACAHARLRRTGTHRWISRMAMGPDGVPADILVAAYRHAAEGGRIGSCLPGPSPALRLLLESGLRIIDRDTFLASDPAVFDPGRRISDGGIL